jgi:hypothetical protein
MLHRMMHAGNIGRRTPPEIVASARERPLNSFMQSPAASRPARRQAAPNSTTAARGDSWMKHLLTAVFAGALAIAVPLASAQTAAPATPAKPATTNSQQDRMKSCNEKAKAMKGDERKTYMSACLSGKEPEKPLTAQQQRMKDCNARATGKTGEDRKKFMSECLKG